jgi:hypothetical protein
VNTAILSALTFACNLAAQVLVVDRGLPPGKPASQSIELAGELAGKPAGKGFLGDTFRVGAAGEIWMIDTIRVWAAPKPAAAGCLNLPDVNLPDVNLGDSLEKITLLGALENQPVPGQPECDCHALVAVATATLRKSGSASANRDVEITAANGLWQIDFRNVRWSMPGGQEVLFSVRATDRLKADRPKADRPKAACPLAAGWSLAAAPARAGYRLRRFTPTGVPEGFEVAAAEPVRISVQVWAHRAD